jgi:phosphatidylglycerophosphate synthase
VLTVRTAVTGGLLAQAALLAAIAGISGLGLAGWAAGLACGAVVNLLLARTLVRFGAGALGPANAVTLVRATLVGAVAALVVDGWSRPVHVLPVVVLSTVALLLDALDGWVARRTRTATAVGARFDMEVDAFLILVLSVQASRAFGLWVLAIGLARYLFVAAGPVWPWLREPTPTRYWRKTVAAIQGVVLTAAVAGILPHPVTFAALVAALTLLAESFGRDVWWLWQRHHHRPPSAAPALRTVVQRVTTSGAFLLVWAALVLPHRIGDLSPGGFVRIPVEGLLVVVLALALPSRPRTAMAVAVGALLGLIAVGKILDLAFTDFLDRPFNPITDQGSFGPALGVVRDSVGATWARAAEVGAVLVLLAVLAILILSVVRLANLAARHRSASARTVTAIGFVWVALAVSGLNTAGAPIASAGSTAFAFDQVRQIGATVRDERTFSQTLTADDPTAATPADELLTGLRGKDVIVAVVESYGRVAVQGSSVSSEVDAALKTDSDTLHAAGFDSRSGFLTSPTFGGISWLAHSTLQSGLWIDSQQRYDQLMSSNRFTLSDAFERAGWRTVSDIPSDQQDWPDGHSFYHYEQIYDDRNVGYAGPRFSYATMPDQYVLSAFQRRELMQPGHRPVMAEIDLVSSHTPWAPLPRIVDWNAVGDGSIFDPMPAEGQSPSVVWRNRDQVKAAYGQSIQYTLAALTSFVQNAHDDNLVLVVYGDHQPSATVSGSKATHDVPISIVAHDPAVLDRISSWGWQGGLLPGPDAPVWPMDQFRDRFLSAYGPA